MATKIEKRSDRRKERDEGYEETNKKSKEYEESKEILQRDRKQWMLFALTIVLIWILFKFAE